MIQSLTILHKSTGLQKLVDKSEILVIAEALLAVLDVKSGQQLSEDQKKLISKFNQKWNKDHDKHIERNIMAEVLLRSDKAIDAFIEKQILDHCLNLTQHHCLIHGDAHGGNFIVVHKGLRKEVHLIDVEEVYGLPGEEKKHYLYDLIKFSISAHNLSRILRKPLELSDIIDIYDTYFSSH